MKNGKAAAVRRGERAPYLRNCWYVAAWDHEVRRLSALRRIVLGEPLLLYRKSDGKPVALEDRCCHRHAPLSSGRIRGDLVECGYHGLVYDPSGRCISIPGQDTAPKGARVKAYPVIERHRWIWVWMGEPELADESLIEDFRWLDDPGWRAKGEVLRLEANYMLLVENLCDLSHLPYVHRTSLASTAIRQNDIPVKTVRGEQSLTVERWVLGDAVPPYFATIAGFDRTATVDRWMHLVFTPPAMVRLEIGAAPASSGAREGDRSRAATTRNLNAITPETERTAHYFWAQAQDFALDDPSIADLDYQLVHKAFLEDLAIIKAQQANIDLDPHVARLNIPTDAGGVIARRIVNELIAAERRTGGVVVGRAGEARKTPPSRVRRG